MTAPPISPGNRLRALMDKGCVMIPGAVKAARETGKLANGQTGTSDLANDGFIVCARTDAHGVEDAGGMDEAVRRAREYVQAGADMIFPEGLESEHEFQQFAHALKGD